MMKKALLVTAFLILPLLAAAEFEDPFHWDFEQKSDSLQPGESFGLEITFRIPPKHILYWDKISLTIKDSEQASFYELGPLETSPTVSEPDPFSGEMKEVFQGGALIRTTLKAKSGAPAGPAKISLQLTYQGCSDTLCYRMMRPEIPLDLTIESASAHPQHGMELGEDSPFKEKNFLLLLALVFAGGIASDFTPCVLPIIPITLAFIGVRKNSRETSKNFVLSLFLVLSMSATYAVLGLVVALLGKNLGFLFQSSTFLILASILYFVFALSLLGLFQIQFPLSLRNAFAKMGGQGVVGAVLAGFTVGFLAAPCVGPLIASLLLYVAQERNLSKGFILLFAYGLGMGSVFLVIGTYYHKLASKVHGGPFMVWVKRLLAVAMLLPAAYYGWIAWQHFKTDEVSVTQELFWNLDDEEAFARARETNRPIFMDFFATWCLPCVEMEANTFSDESVQKLLLEKFVPLKIECTQETPQCQKMVERYGVVGWPAFVLIRPDGRVIEKIVGRSFKPAELREILEKGLSDY